MIREGQMMVLPYQPMTLCQRRVMGRVLWRSFHSPAGIDFDYGF